MTIREFCENNMLCPDSVLDTEDYVVISSEFQNLLNEWVLVHYGSLKLRRCYSNTAPSIVLNHLYNMYESNKYKFQGLYESTLLQYNPLNNYDMTETSTDTTHGSTTNILDMGAQTSSSSASSDVSPYDTETYKHENQSSSSATTGPRSDVNSGESNGTLSHTLSRSGNIGVTTSSQLIDQHRQTLLYNFVSVVAKEVIKTIAVRVYDFEED